MNQRENPEDAAFPCKCSKFPLTNLMVCIGLVIHFWITGLNIKKGSESARLQQGNEGRPGEHVDLTRLRTSVSPTAKKTSRHSGMSETYYLLEPFSRPWQRKGKAVESLFRRHRTAKETQNWLWRGKRPCVLAEREVKGKLADEGRVRESERESHFGNAIIVHREEDFIGILCPGGKEGGEN